MASIINTKIIRQGLMKKPPAAKKKDEVRKGTWQERWFVLKKTTLFYYKKRGDTRPKGEIDLRAAIIEDADVKTRKEFTIRIHQASQVFNYLQCSSQAEKEAWLEDIRSAAGYKAPKVEDQIFASEYYASFGVLKQGLDGNLRRVVLIPDEKKQLVHVAFEQQFVKRYPTSIIRKAVCSKTVTVSNFFEVRLVLCPDPRLPNEIKEKVFYMATKDEALACSTLINNFCQGDRLKIQDLSNTPPKQKGFLEMQGLADRAWVRLWAVLVEKRCLLYNSVDDTIPVWIVWISGKPAKEGRCGLSYKDPHQTWNFRFDDTAERNAWCEGFESISKSFEQALTDQLENLEVEKPVRQVPVVDKKRGSALVKTARVISDATSSFVVTWGLGKSGQLGNGTVQSTSFPQVTRLLSDKKCRDAKAGANFCCVVTRSGQCYTWGAGKHGELGLGESALKKNYPCLVVSLRSTGVQAVACGRGHVLALTENGQIFSWGSGERGQLGHGAASNMYKPKIIAFFRDLESQSPGSEGVTVVQIAAGGKHSAAIIEGRTSVYTWGDNTHGQLGLGGDASERVFKPQAVRAFTTTEDAGGKECTVVQCGEATSAFITTDGELYMCGANDSGQLGLGDNKKRTTPKLVSPQAFGEGSSLVTQVACGAHHTLATAGDELYAWGAARLNGRPRSTNLPSAELLKDVKLVSCSATHSVVVDSQYHAESFGQNEHGELGIEETKEAKGIVPVNLAEGLVCLSVSCGDHFSIALIEGRRPDRLHRSIENDNRSAENFANQQAGMLLNQLEASLPQGGSGGKGASAEAQRQARQKHEAAAAAAAAQKKAAAPSGGKQGVWKEVMDPKSGRAYYYHTLTRETRWKRPTDGLPIVKKHMPS